ncbi:MAG: hypothetical protein QXS19_04400 [Candidatus Methanomethylicia archaeon]
MLIDLKEIYVKIYEKSKITLKNFNIKLHFIFDEYKTEDKTVISLMIASIEKFNFKVDITSTSIV